MGPWMAVIRRKCWKRGLLPGEDVLYVTVGLEKIKVTGVKQLADHHLTINQEEMPFSFSKSPLFSSLSLKI